MSGNYKYYDYLKKYDAHFLNKYESWFNYAWGRRSNYTQLLNYKAYSLWTGGRSIFVYGTKLKSSYMVVCALICNLDLWGVWYFQEFYNKFMPWKWVSYSPSIKEQFKFMEYIIFKIVTCIALKYLKKKDPLLE